MGLPWATLGNANVDRWIDDTLTAARRYTLMCDKYGIREPTAEVLHALVNAADWNELDLIDEPIRAPGRWHRLLDYVRHEADDRVRPIRAAIAKRERAERSRRGF